MEAFWRRCNTCKQEIPFATTYYVCSVSTCHRKGTDFAFCSVPCWDAHVPLFRHRDAWAEERRSPSRGEWQRVHPQAEEKPAPVVTRPSPSVAPTTAAPSASSVTSSTPAARPEPATPPPVVLSEPPPPDILVVASKLKAYIRARSGMNTSDGVLEVLSDRLRELCDDAIQRAAESGRKTVLDRDF